MNYNIKKADFEISNFTIASTNIINTNLIIHFNNTHQTYKISNYIGKGTVGQVYLIESKQSSHMYVIKISNSECIDDLIDECQLIQEYFIKNSIIHPSYPICSGFFKNIKAFGIVYPYFGFYNLEKIKSIDYVIDFSHNKQIIRQIISQMIKFKNIIHCDLKPSNVVINVTNNNLNATIIDFGLIKDINMEPYVISTSYITSPESLLTSVKFSECLNSNDDIQLEKHDYFGLFSICLNLFIVKSFWTMIVKYLTDINFNSDFLHKQSASTVFVYMWFRFSYSEKCHIANKSLLNVINKIESIYPNISGKKFINYDDFFDNYVCSFINYKTIGKINLEDLKDFTRQLIQFDYSIRPELSDLIKHKFLLS